MNIIHGTYGQPDWLLRGLMAALTFIIIADVRVSRVQVDVVLPALTFTALQSALCAHPRTHFLHAETESITCICIRRWCVNGWQRCLVMEH